MKNPISDYINDEKIGTNKDLRTSEVCDMETGECETVKLVDGFLSRDEIRKLKGKIQVETIKGIKQLLID